MKLMNEREWIHHNVQEKMKSNSLFWSNFFAPEAEQSILTSLSRFYFTQLWEIEINIYILCVGRGNEAEKSSSLIKGHENKGKKEK